MGNWQAWKKRVWGMLASAALLLLAVTQGRAEFLCIRTTGQGCAESNAVGEEPLKANFLPVNGLRARAAADPAKDWQTSLQKLYSDWQAIRETLVRSLLETTITTFYITPGVTPAVKVNSKTPVVVPKQTKTTVSSGTIPAGSGNTKKPDPFTAPPPSAPEPSSMVSALLGAGLAGWFAWRKRRVH